MVIRHWFGLFLLLTLLISIVSADSDYCTPSTGLNVTVNTQGIWQNITINSDVCLVWTADEYGNISGTACDNTPPASITNLVSKIECDTIEWNWDNPADADFNHTMVYWNGTFAYNISNATSNVDWTGLAASTSYTISTHTVDITGNVNATWVNKTESTTACGVAPVAGFSADNTTICEYDSVQFTDLTTNTPTNWDWYPWGNETKASDLASPLIPYDIAGLFSVRLYASNGAGNDWENKTNYINVTDCTPPDTIQKLTHLEDCYNITWSWLDPTDPDFALVMVYKNGVFFHNITAGVETDPWTGLVTNTSYEISTRTVDTSGNADTDWVNHTVITDLCGDPPVANFTGTPLAVCLGENVTFTDTSTNTPTIWLWAFGDGNHSHLKNPSFNWSAIGDFDISLKAGNAFGDNTTVKTGYVNVTDCTIPPTAAFSSNVTCGIINFTVQFTDTSAGGAITDWYWDFGDGVTSIEEDPVVNYSVVGFYGVDHSVTSYLGTSWSNVSGYLAARAVGDTCTAPVTGGLQYDTNNYKPGWFTSWWF